MTIKIFYYSSLKFEILLFFLFIQTSGKFHKIPRFISPQIRRQEPLAPGFPFYPNESFQGPLPVPKFDETSRPRTRPPDKIKLSAGLVLPFSTFRRREYDREVANSISWFKRQKDYQILQNNNYEINIIKSTLHASSSPKQILETLCNKFLPKNISAILYISNSETYGRSTASVQYFFQLAGYLGIPVLAWNADNSGLERRAASLQLQLAPSVEQQATAMLSILERYNWNRFAVVTSQIAGNSDFVQALREAILQKKEFGLEFQMTDIIRIGSKIRDDLTPLIHSEARIIFLYSTRSEAARIMATAEEFGLTGKNYLWIVTQSVIQSTMESPKELQLGMLGIHFPTSDTAMISEIKSAIAVFLTGATKFIEAETGRGTAPDLSSFLSCEKNDSTWQGGLNFYRYLNNVSIDLDEELKLLKLEFSASGTRKNVQLSIMNLRPGSADQLEWAEIGTWHSWKSGLDIKDIVWPGHSHLPPNGIPEKFHLKVTFMEELPFINMASPHPVTGKCTANKGVLCRIATDEMMKGVNMSWAIRNSSYFQCCSGFCIDLMVKFSQDLGFSYDFFRVEDGIWGAIVNGKWTGLPGAIINGKADMIMTSIKINSEREEVLDFTVPFLDTGITIVVAKRGGIISPTAFLEPFDTASWMLVALVAIQVAAISIFIFEWLSPAGFNMKNTPPRDHNFSLCRTLWMVWAILFQAAVNVDCPRSYTARFMGNVWAMFALIFLAIYTANLAAFMITREEFYDLSGIEDKRLQNPTSVKPPFRFGTTLHGNTDVVVKKSFPEMHAYMRQFNQTSPVQGFKSVKKGLLDAFLYDATVLEYLTGQDDECKMLTVGSWYALTGYGVAFPRNSKYIDLFNDLIMKYRENGDLERLRRFWFSGACKPEQPQKSSSKPLSLEQFMSTFVLLGCGIFLSLLLLCLEYVYFKYIRDKINKSGKAKYCSLLSMTMGRKPTFADTVMMAYGATTFRCDDPLCDVYSLRVRHDLDMAHLRIQHLERQLVAHGLRKPTPTPIGLPPIELPHSSFPQNAESSSSTRLIRQPLIDANRFNFREFAEFETVL